MNKKVLIFTSMLFLVACNEQRSDNSTSSSLATMPKLKYERNIPSDNFKSYEGIEKTFKTFPNFNVESPGLEYELSTDGTYYIVSASKTYSTPDLVIPSLHEGLPVKKIKNDGFSYKTWLRSAYVPASIEEVGAGAFNGSGLKELYWDAKNVDDFNGRNWVFLPSSSTTPQSMDVYFGPNVESIPARMFFPLSTNPNSIPMVKNIYFSVDSQLKSIGDYAFYRLDAYSNINLPDSLETIGQYAFYGNKLLELTLPESLKSIGDYAFSFTKATNIKFNDQLETIGQYAFFNAANLESVDLSNTHIEAISLGAFMDCEVLSHLRLGNSIKKVASRAFKNTNMSILDLPLNVEVIEDEAFANCANLNYLKLNKNLKDIGASAFANALNMKRIIVESEKLNDFMANNHIFDNLGKNFTDLDVVILGNVNYVPKRMFLNSSDPTLSPNIKRLIIENGVNEIGENAFFDLEISCVAFIGNNEQLNNLNVGNYNGVLNTITCYEKEGA